MAGLSRCWERKHINTEQSDHGYGLYATRDIPRGKTVLTEHLERAVSFGVLDGMEDLPEDFVLGHKYLTLDDFLIARAKAIHGERPTLLYMFPPEGPSTDRVTGVPGSHNEKMLLVTPSIVNHSCAPNMLRVDRTNLETRLLECRFVAMRNINIGDQLTISYDPRMPKWELPHTRRAFLSERYGFFCRCRKCVSQSGWRDLMPLAPATAERVRFVSGAGLDSGELTLPTSNEQIVSQEPTVPLGGSAGGAPAASTIPLQSIGNSAAINKAPRKERFASWVGATSRRTKTWLKNVPGEAKKALGENKIPTK